MMNRSLYSCSKWVLSLIVLVQLSDPLACHAQTTVALPDSAVHAVPAQDDPYFSVSSVETSLTETAETGQYSFPEIPKPKPKTPFEIAQPFSIDPMTIAAVLTKVWDIVVANAPVYGVKNQTITALPELARGNWQALTGWKSQRSVTLTTSVINGFGMHVIDLSYDLRLIYGGAVRGKGLFIAAAQVLPRVKVLWGYKLDVEVTLDALVNKSSHEDDPLAEVTLGLNYGYSNPFMKVTKGEQYTMNGAGLIKDNRTEQEFFTENESLIKP